MVHQQIRENVYEKNKRDGVVLRFSGNEGGQPEGIRQKSSSNLLNFFTRRFRHLSTTKPTNQHERRPVIVQPSKAFQK